MLLDVAEASLIHYRKDGSLNQWIIWSNSRLCCGPSGRIGLAAAVALGRRGAHVVVSSRRKANVDRAVATLQGQDIKVTGTTCNVGKSEDREKLVQMASSPCL